MKRRRFLASLGAAIAGATLDPEKLLWRPGAKLISIPRPSPAPFMFSPADHARFIRTGLFGQPYYPQPLFTVDEIFADLAMLPKIGDTIQVNRPRRFVASQGRLDYFPNFPILYKRVR